MEGSLPDAVSLNSLVVGKPGEEGDGRGDAERSMGRRGC